MRHTAPMPLLALLTLLLALSLAACGERTADDDTGLEPSEATPEAAAPDAPLLAEAPFALTVADLDAYQRGMTREIALLEEADHQYRATTDETEQLEVLSAAAPSVTEEAGAEQAGVSLERYRRIKDAVGSVLGAEEMRAAMTAQMAEVDTTELDAEMRARVRASQAEMEAAWGDPYRDLAPDVADALRARRDELATLRAQLMGLQFNLGR